MEKVELHPARQITLMVLALAATFPGIYLRLSGAHVDPVIEVFVLWFEIVVG
jgi:hypothetical protein